MVLKMMVIMMMIMSIMMMMMMMMIQNLTALKMPFFGGKKTTAIYCASGCTACVRVEVGAKCDERRGGGRGRVVLQTRLSLIAQVVITRGGNER